MVRIKTKTDHAAKLWKIGKGALVSTGGGLLTVVTLWVAEWLADLDIGFWTPIVVPALAVLWSSVVNSLKVYFVDKGKG